MTSSVARPATSIVAATVVGFLAAAPVAIRLPERALLGGLAVAGIIALAAAPVIIALRDRPFPRRLRALLTSSAIASAPLAVFGMLLKAQTHHRQLGGATYAIVAAGIVLALWPFLLRTEQVAERFGHGSVSRVVGAVLGTLAVAVCVAVGASSGIISSGSAFDLGWTGALIFGASQIAWNPPIWAERAGIGLWVVTVASAIVLLRADPDLENLLSAKTIVFASFSGSSSG